MKLLQSLLIALLLPQSALMAAPDWVKPGTRITIWVGSATYNEWGNMTTKVPDPNGHWVNKDGNSFRKSTAGGAAGSMPVDVLDQDPVTLYRPHLEYKGSSNQGLPIVGIVEEGPGGLASGVCDARTGDLIGTSLVSHLPEGMGVTIFYTERVR